MINPETIAAQYKGKIVVDPVQQQDLYETGSSQAPSGIGQLKGTPIPEGQFIQALTGRGMAIVPPQQNQPPQPQMAMVPPTGAIRTAVGTIVEPSKTNPLDSVTIPEPAPVKPLKPKRELDLAKLIAEHIFELGGENSEAAQKFYNKSHDTLKKWLQVPAIIPLGAIVKYMHRTPGLKEDILEELEPHLEKAGQSITSNPNRTKLDVMLCTPVLDKPTLPYEIATRYLVKKYELGFTTFEADTVVSRSRNMLAKRFLESGCTWSLWIDTDMVVPIGKPDWFKSVSVPSNIPEEYCAYNALDRLLNHKKAMIGGVYAGRRWRGPLIIQPEIHPRDHEDTLLCNEIRRGTARGIKEVDWIGFGLALIHREVFLEVQRNFPQLAPQTEFAPWRFFQIEKDEGEDEAFCKRVRICNIPIWLDTQLIAGHIGPMCFLPEHTQHRPAI
jgi:hypothetical protein